MADNPYEGPNLDPPEGGYEIRAVMRQGEAFSYPGGVFPEEAFEPRKRVPT